jgi:hypothetical protein
VVGAISGEIGTLITSTMIPNAATMTPQIRIGMRKNDARFGLTVAIAARTGTGAESRAAPAGS